MIEKTKKIVLASASPRRKELLQRIGLKFIIDVSDYKEDMDLQMEPHQLAQYLSLEKGKLVAKRYKDAIIISADTFIVFNNKILGKPHAPENAKDMLQKLSGNTHLVITGFAIIDTSSGKHISKYSETKISMRKISEEQIDAYIKTKEPLDKAGAYAIQEKGSIFIKKVDGDFFNAVGLPIYALVEELKKFGVYVL